MKSLGRIWRHAPVFIIACLLLAIGFLLWNHLNSELPGLRVGIINNSEEEVELIWRTVADRAEYWKLEIPPSSRSIHPFPNTRDDGEIDWSPFPEGFEVTAKWKSAGNVAETRLGEQRKSQGELWVLEITRDEIRFYPKSHSQVDAIFNQ